MQHGSQLSRIIPSVGMIAAILGIALLLFSIRKVNQAEEAWNNSRTLLQEQSEAASALLEVAASQTLSEEGPPKLEAWRTKWLLRVSELSIVFAREPRAFSQVEAEAAVIDLKRGRMVSKSRTFDSKTFTSAVKTTLISSAKRSVNAAFWMEEQHYGWAVSPEYSSNYRTILRIPLSEQKTVVTSHEESKAKIQSALVSLAEDTASKTSEINSSAEITLLTLIGLALILLSAIILIKIQFRDPLEQLGLSMRQWLSGDKGTKVRTDVGAASVKLVSSSVNQMIEQVDVRRQGRLRGIADGAFALATSLRMVAQGDLKLIPPTVPNELSPIATAIEEMVIALNAAVQSLYKNSTQAVNQLRGVNHGTIQVLVSLRGQLEAIERLANEYDTHAANVREYPDSLTQSLKHFEGILAKCNASAQRIRMGVAVISRKSTGIGELSQRLKSSLIEATALEDSLELLSILSDESASVAERESAIAKCSTTLLTAQSALEQIKQLGTAVHRDIEDVRRGLGGLSLEQLPDMGTHFDEPSKVFLDVMNQVSFSVQGINEILGVISHNSEQMRESLIHVAENLAERDELAQQLDTALSRFDLDGELDAELIARLESARKQYLELEGDELSDEAKRMTKEIQQAASQTRQRLNEMLDAVEATADAIRNSSL